MHVRRRADHRSIDSSDRVMSIGVPNVLMVVKKDSS
ncbi:MAG: hypothetical protein V7646_3996 [Pseudonocardia sp.]